MNQNLFYIICNKKTVTYFARKIHILSECNRYGLFLKSAKLYIFGFLHLVFVYFTILPGFLQIFKFEVTVEQL